MLPVSAWTRSQRRWVLLLAVALTAAITFRNGNHLGDIFAQPDTIWYAHIALGDSAHVREPFVWRQLSALAVRGLHALLPGPIQGAFMVEGYISVLIFAWATFWIVLRTNAPRWILLALAILPFWAQSFSALTTPDLLYSALLAIFLVLVETEHLFWAAAMMLPLMVTRESTSLTLVCFLIAGWRSLGWRGCLLAVAATAAGSSIVNHLTAAGPSNIEHLPKFFYFLGKAPWNLVRSFGIEPWSNLYPLLCAEPAHKFSLHIGPVRSIGVCGYSSFQPLSVVSACLTTFGLLPLLTAFLWWRARRRLGQSVLLRFCLLYGAAYFLLAPALGTWLIHLYGYSWPLFLIAVPLLFDRQPPSPALPSEAPSTVALVLFLVVHIALCAVIYFFAYRGSAACAIGLNFLGFLLLRNRLPSFQRRTLAT